MKTSFLKQTIHNLKKHLARAWFYLTHHTKMVFLGVGGFFLVIIGLFFIWTATFALPDLDGFEARRIASSTKIYDSTGEVVLFDVHRDARRTVVASDQISPYIKNAAIAIEDERFYQHRGIDLRAIARAIMVNVRGTGISQGGSTITQQVMKNTLLTSDRKITRKIKEWVLSVRIERKMTKDEILTQYLNVVPFGGVMYGVEEASRSFFGKSASEVTLAEAAYLAAIPNAPTFFSPYGNNRDRLENRKNLVLNNMRKLGFITEEEFEVARNEEVAFLPRSNNFGRALHFVEYVRAQVEAKYGRDAIENDGLRIITSLNADLQEFAEQVVQENAIQNTEQWSATNQGAIVIDPHTGHILAMVGSRGYSDREIDGSFNVTLAERQPGSSFKPFIYAAAFDKGYTPETVLFDVRTQFSTSCSPSAITNNTLPCYAPQNYDNEYNGPISLRAALAESRNIPAVKLLYLVGVREAVNFARNLGITSLGNPDRYGLTLVLGGGEVSLLEMSSAYGVFATGGVYNAPVSILRIEDKEGNILEEHQGRPERVLNAQAAALLNSVLKDNEARLPLFGTINNFLFFGEGRDVAGKTGTTNNNRDAWLIGYSPDVVVGVWTGNNDNTPMRRGSAISGPTFRAIMTEALKSTSNFRFEEPAPIDLGSLKPIMRGEWRGGETVTIDTISGKLATQYTPEEARAEVALINPNSILHWVDRNNPLGPAPQNPASDNQYNHWQFAVQAWLQQNWQNLNLVTEIPTEYSTVHSPETMPTFSIISPTSGQSFNANQNITVQLSIQNTYPMRRVQYFVNDFFVGSRNEAPFQSFTFSLADVPQTQETNTLRVVIQDEVFNSVTQEITINKN